MNSNRVKFSQKRKSRDKEYAINVNLRLWKDVITRKKNEKKLITKIQIKIVFRLLFPSIYSFILFFSFSFYRRSKSRSVDHGLAAPFDLDSLRSKVEGRFDSVERLSKGLFFPTKKWKQSDCVAIMFIMLSSCPLIDLPHLYFQMSFDFVCFFVRSLSSIPIIVNTMYSVHCIPCTVCTRNSMHVHRAVVLHSLLRNLISHKDDEDYYTYSVLYHDFNVSLWLVKIV